MSKFNEITKIQKSIIEKGNLLKEEIDILESMLEDSENSLEEDMWKHLKCQAEMDDPDYFEYLFEDLKMDIVEKEQDLEELRTKWKILEIQKRQIKVHNKKGNSNVNNNK